ncbi:hypothetical protein [Chroococcidiopsis sp.]|uniref:hypothetical protein n=1 Tax=Chroococcidiopsis sp. TaxID=3088168 RepID=UPI003F34D80E
MNVAAINRCSLHLGSCLLSSFLFWGSVARADIAITPMVVETEAKRGQAQGTMTVYNQVTFITSVVPRIGVTVYVRKGNVTPNLVASSAKFNPRSNQLSGELKWGEGKKNHTPFSVSLTVPQ